MRDRHVSDTSKNGGLMSVGEIIVELGENAKLILQRLPALEQLAAEALAQEREEALEAGALGFMARAMVQATMPHRRPKESFFERTNGTFTLTMMAPPKVGLPYGTVPRLLMVWLTTEATRNKSRELVLGESLSDFMRQLALVPTGGRWGSITRLREQCRRLFTTSVSCLYSPVEQRSADGEEGFRIADRHVLWWDPKSPDQTELFASMVKLSERFYAELVTSPVVIRMDTLRELKQSPLAIDIYCWLTYRMSYLRRTTTIPWPALELQFGADYRRTRDFKVAFLEHLRAVLKQYPECRVEALDAGLRLQPSPTHVPRNRPVTPVDSRTFPRINGRA
jgi:hypothetical protein